MELQTENNSEEQQYIVSDIKKSSKKITIIISIIVVLVLCVVSAFCIVNSKIKHIKEEALELNNTIEGLECEVNPKSWTPNIMQFVRNEVGIVQDSFL